MHWNKELILHCAGVIQNNGILMCFSDKIFVNVCTFSDAILFQ